MVLDVENGDVLGMASYPTYDPDVWVGGISEKDYKKLTDKYANYPMLNRAIMEAKAVGSTFKVVDAIAGLEEGIITPYETFFCDGSFKPPIATDKTVWKCWSTDGHGSLDLVGAITQSCDVYFYNVGYRFYAAKGTPLADWAKRLGMEKYTGIDIPGEVKGRVPTPAWRQQYFETEVDKLWTPGNSINLAIGQGDLEATPLQLAVTYAAIANGGKIVTPHLGLKIADSAGQTVRELEPAAKSARSTWRRARSTSCAAASTRRPMRLRARPRRCSPATRAGGRQDRHRRGLRLDARRLRGLRLVRELRAGRRPQVRGRRHDREGRPRRHGRRPRRAHHLRRPVQHRQRRVHGAGPERLTRGRAIERSAARRATD